MRSTGIHGIAFSPFGPWRTDRAVLFLSAPITAPDAPKSYRDRIVSHATGPALAVLLPSSEILVPRSCTPSLWKRPREPGIGPSKSRLGASETKYSLGSSGNHA